MAKSHSRSSDHTPSRKTTTKARDIVGKTFGRLTVLGLPDGTNGCKLPCKCECGTVVYVETYSLHSGNTRSCGCIQREWISAKSTTHGLSKTRVYRIWKGICRRCLRPRASRFKYYGGRGITVCDHWAKSFENFYADMGEPPTNKHMIERVNNDLGYCLSNCIWATIGTQARNRRNNRIIEFNGESKSVAEWAEQLNLKYHTLYSRLYTGMSVELALTPQNFRTPKP